MSNDKVPTGHERSYRRGYADGMSEDRRSDSSLNRPENLPNGHGKSYDSGYEDGKNH